MEPVYFDHNATTPLDEKVLEAMLPYLRGNFGNASSRHELGSVARRAVDTARQQVGALVNAQPSQVIFVSGGTEANNLFITGAAGYLKPSQVAVSAIEHPCIAKPAQELARQGWKVRKLAVTRGGQMDLADVDAALQAPTGIVSVMLVNNETGVILDVAAVAERARAGRAWMHTDAVQALGKIPVDFQALGVHAMTVSAHKIYGPKGAAALIMDKRLQLRPIIHGGGHEQGLRSGTENVAGIVGFGAACGGAGGGGAPARAAAAPAGAAASSASPEPSATLLAMGVDPEIARGAVRFSLGAGNAMPQIEEFLTTLKSVVKSLRSLAAIAG